MYEGRLEDDFNSWVRREGCTELGLLISHAKDEECWIAVIEHKNPEIQCENLEKIINFLNKGKQKGYISRHWFENIHDEHLFTIGKKIAFCYNG